MILWIHHGWGLGSETWDLGRPNAKTPTTAMDRHGYSSNRYAGGINFAGQEDGEDGHAVERTRRQTDPNSAAAAGGGGNHGSGNQGSVTAEADQIPIEEAVRALHPPRVTRLSASASVRADPAGAGVPPRSQMGGAEPSSFSTLDVASHLVTAPSAPSGLRKGRFSQLFLEHEEKHLRDWAVVASSSPIASSSVMGAGSGLGGGSGGGGSKRHPRRSRSRRYASDKPERIPSAGMKAVSGRLRLCSQSVVFEPDDVSRGIIRCRFVRMATEPRAVGAQPVEGKNSPAKADPSGGATTAVAFACDRHLLIKVGNTIAPFVTVQVPTEFRFTFRHSSPDQFLDLSDRLLGATGVDDVCELMKTMHDRPFDPNNLIDVRETPRTGNMRCFLLAPLQEHPGCSIVTDRFLYFQPASGPLGSIAEPATAWPLEDVVASARRYHGLKDSAVELYLASGTSVLLAYETKIERERVISLLPKSIPCHTDVAFVQRAYAGWRSGKISNFDYLLCLNSAAGRTFHNISRYPVFPWVVADYSSDELDLEDPNTFRDLAKPVGALNNERLKYFQKRYKGMEGDIEQPFLYGTHYSAPGYVLYYLVRSMPEQMLCLQNGKFDAPDRTFHDLDHTFQSIMSNHADVKELIAEFYDPDAGFDFLINARGLRLGTTQTGERVNDVKLPKWAKTPREFLEKNRMALECDHVTSMVPRWIDLIFGDKSRGEGAEDALNLFHPASYVKSSTFDAMATEEERQQAQLQATEFGITPDLLFCLPHPRRSDLVLGDDFIASDLSDRAMSLDQLGAGEAGENWELLEPPGSVRPGIQPSSKLGSHSRPLADSTHQFSISNSRKNDSRSNHPFDDEAEQSFGQEGGYELAESEGNVSRAFDTRGGEGPTSRMVAPNPSGSFDRPDRRRSGTVEQLSANRNRWGMKPLLSKMIHTDAVSGCSLLVQDTPKKPSYLTTVSLDGRLLVHTLPFLQGEPQEQRGFSASTASYGLSYLGLGGDRGQAQYTLNELRSHSSTDPLACLAVTADRAGGRIAFAGGHDDNVVVYGINSACAVASVYSHRDAVTGVDLIQRSSFNNNFLFGTSGASTMKSTHIMVSGSWDATVKVWSVSIDAGETVSVDREPLVEMFDADSSIVSVSVTEVYGAGIVISAGCSDGSLVVWFCHNSGQKEVVFKEEARRGDGACAAVRWAPGKYLFAAFGNGRVASYLFDNGNVSPVSRISIGSPVQCLSLVEENLFAGCADGSLRMIPIGEGAHFNTSPQSFTRVNGVSSPALTSISISIAQSENLGRKYICASGAEDGSVSIFELEEAAS